MACLSRLIRTRFRVARKFSRKQIFRDILETFLILSFDSNEYTQHIIKLENIIKSENIPNTVDSRYLEFQGTL